MTAHGARSISSYTVTLQFHGEGERTRDKTEPSKINQNSQPQKFWYKGFYKIKKKNLR